MTEIRSAALTAAAQFVSPLWLNGLPNEETVTVGPDGAIIFHGELMKPRNPSPFAPGESVTIRVNRPHIIAYDTEALTAEESRRARAKILAREQERAEDAARAAAAVTTNANLRVPLTWRPEIKVVLSGLTENSHLNGANSRTVTHIRLLGPLHEGRITRKAGDYLCTTPKGSNGSWVELAEAWDEHPQTSPGPSPAKHASKSPAVGRNTTPARREPETL